jgi:hypothetical protein
MFCHHKYKSTEFLIAKRVVHSFNITVLLVEARQRRHAVMKSFVEHIIELRTLFSTIMSELQQLHYKVQHFSHRWQKNVNNDNTFQTFRQSCGDTKSDCMQHNLVPRPFTFERIEFVIIFKCKLYFVHYILSESVLRHKCFYVFGINKIQNIPNA